MNNCLIQYFRCPERYIQLGPKEAASHTTGYFQFGRDATCFGSYYGEHAAKVPGGTLHDAVSDVEIKNGTIYLPFDPSELIDNLLCERYVDEWRVGNFLSALAKVYYDIRPAIPVGMRRLLQKLYLKGRHTPPFPRWPVDCSVDNLLGKLLLLSLTTNRVERIPFIWFWPEGASSATIMTHDVETELGRSFCPNLMDLDDHFGMKASFQIIPEKRYEVSRDFLDSIRKRGYEVAVHDLNHDGNLYSSRDDFLERAARINAHGMEFGAEGFRAGVLYRKQMWYDALHFSYDMSVPNVAHLDPQRGGCCTVMPFFLGKILELPVTTTQDHTVFYILNDFSIDLWKQQTELIMEKHGLMSFIVHPDYVVRARERLVYEGLLGFLDRLRKEKGVWITTPVEVNRWWRQRAQMTLLENGRDWQIEGPGKERARIAYASEKEGRLVFSLQTEANS